MIESFHLANLFSFTEFIRAIVFWTGELV